MCFVSKGQSDEAKPRSREDQFEGFINVDHLDVPGADVMHNLAILPYPFEGESVKEIRATDVEHLANYTAEAQQSFVAFIEQCHRILKPDGKLYVQVPGRVTNLLWEDSPVRVVEDREDVEEFGLGFCVTGPAEVAPLWLLLFPNFHDLVVAKRFLRVSDPRQAANRRDRCCPFDKADALPWVDGQFDYTVSHHPFQMLTDQELDPAMRELYQATKHQGVLRDSALDILKVFAPYDAHKALVILGAVEYSIYAKLCTYLTWDGTNRTLSIFPHLEQLLLRTRFERIFPVACDHTASRYPDIAALDKRPDETLFTERFK